MAPGPSSPTLRLPTATMASPTRTPARSAGPKAARPVTTVRDPRRLRNIPAPPSTAPLQRGPAQQLEGPLEVGPGCGGTDHLGPLLNIGRGRRDPQHQARPGNQALEAETPLRVGLRLDRAGPHPGLDVGGVDRLAGVGVDHPAVQAAPPESRKRRTRAAWKVISAPGDGQPAAAGLGVRRARLARAAGRPLVGRGRPGAPGGAAPTAVSVWLAGPASAVRPARNRPGLRGLGHQLGGDDGLAAGGGPARPRARRRPAPSRLARGGRPGSAGGCLVGGTRARRRGRSPWPVSRRPAVVPAAGAFGVVAAAAVWRAAGAFGVAAAAVAVLLARRARRLCRRSQCRCARLAVPPPPGSPRAEAIPPGTRGFRSPGAALPAGVGRGRRFRAGARPSAPWRSPRRCARRPARARSVAAGFPTGRRWPPAAPLRGGSGLRQRRRPRDVRPSRRLLGQIAGAHAGQLFGLEVLLRHRVQLGRGQALDLRR